VEKQIWLSGSAKRACLLAVYALWGFEGLLSSLCLRLHGGRTRPRWWLRLDEQTCIVCLGISIYPGKRIKFEVTERRTACLEIH
jgi:hypothetical protein